MQLWGQSAALTWTSHCREDADSCGVEGSPSGFSGSEHLGEYVAEEEAHGGREHVQDPCGLPEISRGEEISQKGSGGGASETALTPVDVTVGAHSHLIPGKAQVPMK